MPTVSVQLPSPGDDILASDISGPINAILAVLNGNIDADNLADGAVTTAKIATGAVTQDKLGADALLGWAPIVSPTTSLPITPSSITALGNHYYSCVFNTTDLRSEISAGMFVRTTRSSAAPTQSASLNGSSQYFVKSSPNKMVWTDDFVVSGWIKLSAYSTSNQVMVSRYNGTSGWIFRVNAAGQVSLVGLNGSPSNASLVTSYQSVPLNRWIHVSAQLDMSAFTASSTTSYVMFDGVDVPAIVGRGGTNPTALVQAGNLEIGSNNTGTELFGGKISQIGIYSAKVTQATILATISQGLVGNEISLASAYSLSNSLLDLNTSTPNDLSVGGGSAVTTNADSPFGGQSDGVINSKLDYAEIVSVAFLTNTTVILRVPDGNTLTSGSISAISYSAQENPYGWPGISNIIGFAQLNTNTVVATTVLTDAQGLISSVYVPAGKRLKISFDGSWQAFSGTNTFGYIALVDGSTVVQMALATNSTAGAGVFLAPSVTLRPTAGAHTYKVQAGVSSGTITLNGGPAPSATPTPGPNCLQIEVV